jgi:hypothetical protein
VVSDVDGQVKYDVLRQPFTTHIHSWRVFVYCYSRLCVAWVVGLLCTTLVSEWCWKPSLCFGTLQIDIVLCTTPTHAFAASPLLQPFCTGIWMGSLVLFQSIQAFITMRSSPTLWLRAHLAYTCALTGVACLLIIGYAVGYRADGAFWSVGLFGVCALHTWLYWSLRERNEQYADLSLGEADRELLAVDKAPYYVGSLNAEALSPMQDSSGGIQMTLASPIESADDMPACPRYNHGLVGCTFELADWFSMACMI